MPLGRSLVFSFFFCKPISHSWLHSFIHFIQQIYWALTMCQLLLWGIYIIVVKKSNKYYCPCRNYILNYFDVFRACYLLFWVVITKHCVIMVWKKSQDFFIWILYLLSWYKSLKLSPETKLHSNGQFLFEFELKY